MAKKSSLAMKVRFLAITLLRSRHFNEILVSFDRVDQELSNDTKFDISDFVHLKVMGKNMQISRKMGSESIIVGFLNLFFELIFN